PPTPRPEFYPLSLHERLPRLRLARLQRSDDALHPGARLAHSSRGARGLDRVDRRVSVGHVLRPDARRVRSAVRTPLLARVDRLPRYPGRLHAGPRDRLL